MKINIKDKLEKIDQDHYSLLVNIGKVALDMKLKAYLVGGMVRDLLLGFENLDIDIVVENNAKVLSLALVKKFSNCEIQAKHDRFHTAKLVFNINRKKIPIDLASTREEIYEHPASLPKVSISELKKDLYRRDFTINALAVSLLPSEFGEVVDLFDGLADLKNKKIKVLHDLSFIDDPTRMIRAIRFKAKLGFEIEEHTQSLLKKVIDSKQFDNLIEKIRGDRVKIEIRYLFNLSNIQEAIDVFFKSEVYKLVSTELRAGLVLPLQMPSYKGWLVYLAFVMQSISDEKKQKIMKNLQLTSDEIKIINNGFNAFNQLQIPKNNKLLDPVFVYHKLKNLSSESVQIVKLLIDDKNIIDEYIEKTSKIKLEISGQDLISMGVPQGKEVGEMLEKVLEIKIKNPNMKKDDEIILAQTYILSVIAFLLTI